MLSRQPKRIECRGESAGTVVSLNECFFFSSSRPLSHPWVLNSESDCLPRCFAHQTTSCFSYFNSPGTLEEFTDCKTDVFILFYPPQWLSLNNISLWIWLLYPLKREGGRGGRHMAVRSTKHVISINRDGPWGCVLLWCDLLVSVSLQFSLEWLFVRWQGRGG